VTTVKARKTAKKRADALLVDRGLVDTRSKAQALILAGKVFSGEERVTKAGTLLPESAELRLSAAPRFVSRGGYKLEGALLSLGVDVTGWVCVDVGASTGGFTDCLLQRGARRVYAADVGQGLLAESLVRDERVVVRDKTNARHLTASDFDEAIDCVVVDASFIGIEKMTDAFARLLPPGGTLLAMVKPQFEVGKEAARRAKGVIIDPELRAQALASARAAIEHAGFVVLGGADSVLAGPKGNVEYFVHARRLKEP
jgi:23S rRNA (cytidine1920-2'-O)/16S rRNA (cytidine1409-2'-O)-methyltransferase